MKVVLIAGARPNFMKIAPLVRAMHARNDMTPFIVHTGQHYDDSMSRVFFDELEIPAPDVNLAVGSASHAVQTATVMTAVEPVLVAEQPDWVLVVGDVNSTLAAALTAAKLDIPVGHVEAGLRSGNRGMPEEINRLATDAISDLLFAPSADAADNLRREGHPEARIALVGNVMVDTLLHRLAGLDTEAVVRGHGLEGDYVLVTLHRPSNVDDPLRLQGFMEALGIVARDIPVVFPVHPRTRALLASLGVSENGDGGLRLLEPRPYTEFIALQNHARVVITDSGGIQEETTVLGVPCLTVRNETERPITVTQGTNRILGPDPSRLPVAVRRVLHQAPGRKKRPDLWDGQAGARIVARLGREGAVTSDQREARSA